MKWSLIVKGTPPTSGTYKDWKGLLRIEGQRRCVYCAIPEAAFGGLRNFHVEHFRPKATFSALKNNYANLFYVCAICNSFKGDTFVDITPLERTRACFPDPSLTNYAELFATDKHGSVNGEVAAGTFLVVRLYLNRPQLILERRLETVVHMGKNEAQAAMGLAQETGTSIADTRALLFLISSFLNSVLRIRDVPPYEAEDVTRS